MVTWTSELHLNAPCACLRKTWHFLHWFNSILKVINASPTVREACTSVTVQSTRAASMFLFLPPTFWSHPWPLSFFSDYNPSEVEILFGLRLGNGLAGCAGYLRFSKNSHSCLSNKNREEKEGRQDLLPCHGDGQFFLPLLFTSGWGFAHLPPSSLLPFCPPNTQRHSHNYSNVSLLFIVMLDRGEQMIIQLLLNGSCRKPCCSSSTAHCSVVANSSTTGQQEYISPTHTCLYSNYSHGLQPTS